MVNGFSSMFVLVSFGVVLDVQDCCPLVNFRGRWCFGIFTRVLLECSPATVLFVTARPSCLFHDVGWMLKFLKVVILRSFAVDVGCLVLCVFSAQCVSSRCLTAFGSYCAVPLVNWNCVMA